MVTGLGGVFLKAGNPKYMARWYEDNLGIGFHDSFYFNFKWREPENPDRIGYTVFSFFKEDTHYFQPSINDVMINLRVSNLDELRIRLKNNGVFVTDQVEAFEYGRFGWALDPEGNKIELWEPVDSAFEDYNEPMDLKNTTGFGGIFIKSKNPEELMKWYAIQLGLFFSYSSHTFQWKDLYEKNHTGYTVMSFFSENSSYFNPSKKQFMFNFRVSDLDKLLKSLRSSGIEVIDNTENYEYGRFGWLIDPEGNKIELWEPVDEKFVF